MASTPKPARKKVKLEIKAIKSAVNNPKHGFSHKKKKEVMSELITGSKKRHTSSAHKMKKFSKKHPGESYEE